MANAVRYFRSPSIESILAARSRDGVFLRLLDAQTNDPLYVRVLDAIHSVIEPHRLSLFVAVADDEQTRLEGAVQMQDGHFVAEVIVTQAQSAIPAA